MSEGGIADLSAVADDAEVIVVLLVALSCTQKVAGEPEACLSDSDIQRQVDGWVDDGNNACNSDSDCELVYVEFGSACNSYTSVNSASVYGFYHLVFSLEEERCESDTIIACQDTCCPAVECTEEGVCHALQ